MNFVSETRNKSGTKNGFLGKSSFFCLHYFSFLSLACNQSTNPSFTMLPHPDSIYVFSYIQELPAKREKYCFQ